MNKFTQFLTFSLEILVIPAKAIINVHGKFKPFSFFFALRILSASLRRDTLR